MDFIDLHRQYEEMQTDLQKRLQTIFMHKHFIMGPEIQELEDKLAAFSGRKYALSCGNGTDALVLGLMALDIKPGDAVFVPSFTFFATAESVAFLGATPIFVDSDASYNIDCQHLEKEILRIKNEGKLNPRGIIPVDLFGLSADYDEIEKIADKYHLFVLEDAAQGFGGSYKGRKNASFGTISTTSFFPAKPLGCYGDGGAVFTDDEALADKIRSLRVHGGGTDKYDNVRIGMNARMDTLQAAVLLSKLQLFEAEIDARQKVAARYRNNLEGSFELPQIPKDKISAWAQFSILATSSEERAECIEALKREGIPSMIYYPIPLHLQRAFSHLDEKEGQLPRCEDFSKRIFSLPMHPYLREEEIDKICRVLIDKK